MAKMKPMAVKKMPVNKPAMPGITSANAMGKSGTFLQNVNVRPTRLQTAVHDAKYFTKSLSNSVKEDLKSSKVKSKIGGAVGAVVSGVTAAVAPGLYALPSAINVISGQARYNKNKRAMMERGESIDNTATSMSKSDSLAATKGQLNSPRVYRDTPLPSSDGILKNAVNKLSDLIKR
jgi:hypothetical protein